MGAERGEKHDAGKPRYDLIPPRALHQVVLVLTRGAEKYAPDNWRHVEHWRARYFAAAMRHCWEYLRAVTYGGPVTDPETGLHHLAHAACCLLFMLELDGREGVR